MRITGPAALGLQLSVLEDWNWATGKLLVEELAWPVTPRGTSAALVLPSGPADRLETASLMYQQAIQAAAERIWIASPYFVPDDAVVGALHLAALRGVDVRILVPDRSDNPIVDAAALTFFDALLASGIRIHRYRGGFLHSKHFVIDDLVVGVGTANLDNRSLRLNFEVTALVRRPALRIRGRRDVRARPRPLTPDDPRRARRPPLPAPRLLPRRPPPLPGPLRQARTRMNRGGNAPERREPTWASPARQGPCVARSSARSTVGPLRAALHPAAPSSL